MLTGLALHCLRGLLFERLGVDIDNADCSVEHLSASHVCLRLQDVALTQALWRLLVGIDYPFFVDYGRASEVRVEINSDTCYAEVRGVFFKLRLLRPQEWAAAAEAYRAQVAKQKDRLLNGTRSSETVRWMKAKMKAVVTSFTLVLQDDVAPAACGLHSLAVVCSSVTLADPDDSLLLTAQATDTTGAGHGARAQDVPFHSRGRDSFALMAKDLVVDDLQVFISDAPPAAADLSKPDAWRKEDAVCPRLTICVAYRAWDITALQEYPEAAHEPRKKIVLHMRAGGVEAREAPVLVRLRAMAFMFLLRLVCDTDSLLNLYTSVLRAGAADINAKPSGEETHQYMELWSQHKATTFGRSRALVDLEHRLAGGFILRLREISTAMEKGREVADEPTDSRASASSVPMERDIVQVFEEVHPDDSPPLWINSDIEVSPSLPRGIGRIFSDGKVGCGRCNGLAHRGHGTNSTGGCFGFVVDSAMRLHIPDFALRLDLQGLQTSPGSEQLPELTGKRSWGMLHITMPRLSLDYIRDMDSRHIAVESDYLAMEVDSRKLLEWTSLRMGMDDFGEASRKVQLAGQISVEPLGIWPYLDLLPGWKSTASYSDAFAQWYGSECQLPSLLESAFTVESASRTKTYDMKIPSLHVELPPRLLALPPLAVDVHDIVFEGSFTGTLHSRFDFLQVLCAKADLPQGLPLLAMPKRVMVSRRGNDYQCDVIVPSVDVNLAPFMLHVLYQYAAFDPRVKRPPSKKQSSTAAKSGAATLPNLAVSIQAAMLQFWESTGFANPADGDAESCQPARVRLKARGLELSSSTETLDVSKLQLQVKGLHGMKLANGDVYAGTTFLCSGLDSEPPCHCTRHGAFKAELRVGNGQRELKIFGASLHLAPSVELLTWAKIVLPLPQSKRAARSSAFDQANRASGSDQEMVWCSVANAGAAGSSESQTSLLLVEEAFAAVHLSSDHERSALTHVAESELLCTASLNEGCLSALAYIQKLHARSTPAGVYTKSLVSQHIDMRAEKLCVAILHAPAKELQISQSVAPVAAALLHTAQLSAVLPTESSSSSSSSAAAPSVTDAADSFRAVALSVQSAAAWTALAPGTAATNSRGHCAVSSSDPELRWPSCPLLSVDDVEKRMQPLLLPHGKGPWLVFSMNGVCVTGCQESAANGFYAVQPLFRNGASVYQKPSTAFSLSSDGQDRWIITKSLPGNDALSPSITVGSYWVHAHARHGTPSVVSLDTLNEYPSAFWILSKQDAHIRVLPCSSRGADRGSFTALVIALAPTLVNGPQPGLHAVYQVYDNACRLLKSGKGGNKAEQSNMRSGTATTAPPNTAGPQQSPSPGAGMPEPPSLQVFVNVQLDIAFPQGLSGSWLRVCCIPRWPKRDVVGDFQELSLDIMTAGTQQGAKPMHHKAVDGRKSMLQVTFCNLYLRMGRASGKEIVVSIPSIRGRYETASGWSTFLQPSESDMHIDFHYLEKKQLELYIWPTALSIHRSWIWPLAGFLLDASQWYKSGVLNELKTSSSLDERLSYKEFPQSQCAWEGAAWVFQLDGRKGTTLQMVPDRCLVQFRSDGSMWDITGSKRGLQLWCPEGAKVSDHVSTIFPLSLELQQGHSRLAVAVRAEEDFDCIRTVLGPFTSVQGAASRSNVGQSRSGPEVINITSDLDAGHGIAALMSPTDSVMRREGFLGQLRSNVQRPLRRAYTQVSQTLTQFTSPAAAYATSASSARAGARDLSGATRSRVSLQSSSRNDSTNVEVAIKGLEIWLPTCGDEEENLEQEGSRQLCILVAMEARGALNSNISVTFPDLTIVHIAKPTWYSTEISSRAKETLASSFASLTDWANREDESQAATSPGNRPASPLATPTGWVEARLQLLGATPGDKLMVLNGLAFVVVWSGHRTIGVRAHDMSVRIPLELLMSWRGLQTQYNSFASLLRREAPEAPANASSDFDEDIGSSSHDGPLGIHALQSAETPGTQSFRSGKSSHGVCCGWCSCITLSGAHSTFSNMFSTSNTTSAHTLKSKPVLSQSTISGLLPWTLEIEVLARIDVKFQGGLLAPSQWLVARVSEVLLQGSAPPTDESPLIGTFRCEVLCHNEELALMEPVVESMEVNVDLQRCKDILACSVNTTRVNLNMTRVLVRFCNTIHQGLNSSGDRPLQPIRTFAVLNLTDVMVQVHWQGRRGRHAHGVQRVKLPPRQGSAQILEGVLDRSVELHFDDKEEDEMVLLDLDHTHSRMYLLECSGRHVMVEPNNDVHTGRCVFQIRSPVMIYNETAIPLVLSREQQNTPMGLALALEALRLSTLKPMDVFEAAIQVPAGSSVNVPLSWFSLDWQKALIRPALDGHEFSTFPELSNLLCCGSGADEQVLGSSVGNSAGRGGKTSVSAPGLTGAQERVNFHTYFSRYLKLMGCADACDIPMGGDLDDLPPAQCFEMRFKDVILFRNTLPVPVILQICAKDGFEKSVLPVATMQRVLNTRADVEGGSATGGDPHGAGFVRVSGRCFEPVPATGDVHWKSDLEGVVALILEQKVVSYVLGVDQEVSLPFAKRTVHIRLFMLPETDLLNGSSFVSRGTRLFLPANIDHIAWPKPVTLWRCDDGFGSEGRRPTKQVKQAQALQVSVEVTRNVVTLFAPLVIENLTPWTFHINSEDPAHLLAPLQLRLLPRNHQVKDTIFVALWGQDFSWDPQGQEVVHISDLDRRHRLAPVRAPETCPEKCGLFHDSLSFGVCVRMARPPLELTKVISVLPRFSVHSELSREVEICLAEPSSAGKHSGYLTKRSLRPGECFPVHPPSFAQDTGDALFISDGDRRSLPFDIEPPRSRAERQRTFHVEMMSEAFLKRWTNSHDVDRDIVQQQPPHFYQVALQQAALPAKEGSAYICDGYAVMLRDPHFRGAEDVLFHVENKTMHRITFVVTAGGSTETERPAGVIRHGRPVSLESSSQRWVYRTVSKQKRESRYDIALNFYRSSKSKEPLISITLSSVLTKRPSACAGRFAYQAQALVTQVKEDDDGSVSIVCSMRLDGVAWTASAELVLADRLMKGPRTPEGTGSVYISKVISAEAEGQDSTKVAQILGDNWCVVGLDGARPPRFHGALINYVKEVLAVKGQAELIFQLRFQVNHVEGPDGVQHFTIYDKMGALAVGSKASDMTSFHLNVSVPILSVSWLHRHCEVLAMRVKGIDLRFQRESSSDCSVDASVQHLQVDHFEDGDLPVVLNRRLLHVNSRWLNKKALALQAKWSPSRRIIPEVTVDCVPYWLNLELGVLIRLLERYDSGFSRLGEQTERSEARPLLPPELPVPAEDSTRVQVWRLMKIVIKPMTFTIHMRSPGRSTFTYNLVARWIMRLPADMPNMDVIVMRVELLDQFGTPKQLLKTLMQKYKAEIKTSAVRSIILSYGVTVLKGLLNALVWLARGPFDALVVAKETSFRQRQTVSRLTLWLWWVSPLIHGLSEGMYRALAEVIGNTVFGLVLLLNMVRHVIFGVTRRRAQGILDGMIYGFQGLLFDSFVMPFSQLYYQTTAAHQDWGWGTGAFVFFLCLLRILVGLGPVMGVFHFLSCCCEGVANVLLHEEAQFAPFENQRIIDPVILDPITDDPIDGLQSQETMLHSRSERHQTASTMPRKWWLFTRARDVITDDDEVMEKMMQAWVP